MARPGPAGPRAAPLSSWEEASCQSPESVGLSASSLFLCLPVLSSPFLASAPRISKWSDQFAASKLLLSTFLPTLSASVLPRGLRREPCLFQSPRHSIQPHRDKALRLHRVSDTVTQRTHDTQTQMQMPHEHSPRHRLPAPHLKWFSRSLAPAPFLVPRGSLRGVGLQRRWLRQMRNRFWNVGG